TVNERVDMTNTLDAYFMATDYFTKLILLLDDCQLGNSGFTISVSDEGNETLLYGIGIQRKFFNGHTIWLPSNVISWGLLMQIRTYPPLDDCQLWETLGSTISVSVEGKTLLYGIELTLPSNVISWGFLMQIRSTSELDMDHYAQRIFCGNKLNFTNYYVLFVILFPFYLETYLLSDDCQLWETVGSTIRVSVKERNTSLDTVNERVDMTNTLDAYFMATDYFTTYPPLDDVNYGKLLGFPTIYCYHKDMTTSPMELDSTYGFYQYCPMASIVSYSLVICASATYPPLDDCQLWETLGSTISVSMKDMNTYIWNWNSTLPLALTYPPLDDCQLWETLGSTISVSMKDMNTSLWNWNSTYGFYQYCPMASIVSYSLVICASAWYLNNGSIEYHENSFLIIYSLGMFFKGAHYSCCTPCVSNVSSLWSVLLS
ncbi:hypothetical protein Tco_0658097, partial [Tanacetum coccineum]